MTDVLQIDRLTKTFGAQKVLDGLTLSVPERTIFGFLGQNGAGKTTTMKLILGLLKPDAGKIRVCGERVRFGQTETNRYVGYLPDVPEFYGFMRPMEYLALCGEIAGMNPKDIKKRSAELLELVGLSGVNKKIAGFSRGMKQRLGIAQALLGDPKLLICDEPTSALDPVGRKEILDILGQLRGRATVLFSTHILSDAERICDRVAVLSGGNLVLSGTLDELKARRRSDGLLVEFISREDLEACMARFAFAKPSGLTLTLGAPDIAQVEIELIRFLAEERILPVRLELMEPTLESLFLEAVT